MTKVTRAELKAHFRKGDYPTENDFGNAFDSYVHKDDNISADKVVITDSEGSTSTIGSLIAGKADASTVSGLETRMTDAENDIAENSLDIQATETLAAKMAKILGKGDSESIDTLLARYTALGSGYSTVVEVCEKIKVFLAETDSADSTINRWKEIETFLAGITDTDTLEGMLEDMQETIEAKIPEPGDYVPMNTSLDDADKRYPCVSINNGHIYICKGEHVIIEAGNMYYEVGDNELGLPPGIYYNTGERRDFALSKPDSSHHYHYPLPVTIGDIGCRYGYDEIKYTITAFDAETVTMENSDGEIVVIPNVSDGGGYNYAYRHETEGYEITDPWVDWLYVKEPDGHWSFVKSHQPRNSTFITKKQSEEDIILGGWHDAYDGDISNKYQKPSAGIPKNDLDTSVQTSLGKADTALQLVAKGSDGNYFSTSVGTKSNGQQTISGSITLQDVGAATASKKGVAEAYDVKTYVDGRIATLADSINDETVFAYGVEWSLTSGSPDCTRIGNMYYHKILPIQSRMVGGTITDDGLFTPFSNQSDWTGETRDGSKGQVMVQLPEFYIKFVTKDDRLQVWMSHLPLYGYTKVDKVYVSAYEASLERSSNKLCSVVNTSADYRGGANTSAWDSENTAGYGGESNRSLLGRPASNISLTNFRTYARNRNNGDTRWNCMMYEAQRTLYWLYVVEYATLDSQKAYNSQKTSDGFAQGGLGQGITTWDGNVWNSFNSYNPFVPCGWTDSLGNRTGSMDYTIYNASGGVHKAFLTQDDSGVPRYRGIENPFGHIWQWTDGVLVNVTSTASKVFTCRYPSLYSSTSTGNYTHIGDEARSEGFKKAITFGPYGDITSKTTGGSSSTYYCDYHYCNVGSYSLRGLLFGGIAHYGALAGLVSSPSNYAPTVTHPSVGSRLCFKP